MAKAKNGHWMEEAFKNAHGQLRSKTGTKAGHDISQKSLTKASNSSSPKERKEANLAIIAGRANRGK